MKKRTGFFLQPKYIYTQKTKIMSENKVALGVGVVAVLAVGGTVLYFTAFRNTSSQSQKINEEEERGTFYSNRSQQQQQPSFYDTSSSSLYDDNYVPRNIPDNKERAASQENERQFEERNRGRQVIERLKQDNTKFERRVDKDYKKRLQERAKEEERRKIRDQRDENYVYALQNSEKLRKEQKRAEKLKWERELLEKRAENERIKKENAELRKKKGKAKIAKTFNIVPKKKETYTHSSSLEDWMHQDQYKTFALGTQTALAKALNFRQYDVVDKILDLDDKVKNGSIDMDTAMQEQQTLRNSITANSMEKNPEKLLQVFKERLQRMPAEYQNLANYLLADVEATDDASILRERFFLLENEIKTFYLNGRYR
jgi:hypothetical protein